MGDDRWARMWKLFHEAVELPAGERSAFVEQACGDDHELRARLERLLEAHDRESGLLDASLPEKMRSDEPDPLIGDRIGPYRIVEVIGEGGMGVVYAADQEEPVRRKVALKLIRLGMDTQDVVKRFEAERQALALMNHPCIAAVHDAGATRDGRPYFVMEFVDGVPITEYCDRHRLDTKQRLRLFQRICDGVQHAHQKGIIHRDLKPSNVLVAERDGKPDPKIIDFGVAKATDRRLTEQTMFTALGVWVGTPEYMSPEQAELSGQDLDTRTDVYSLGVLLYELLVGALPFDSKALREAGFDEIRRRIREEQPSKPSTRIDTLDATRSTEAARRRRTDVSSLRRQLSGDLDWITLCALEKDRERRYGSAAELSADVARHLRHEPVLAGPPGAAYLVGKFIRRHRAGATFAAALLVLLIGFAATMTVLAGRIARERDRANQEAERASREAETAKQISDFLLDMFRFARPSQTRGNTITARELLDRGAERIGKELEDQPEVRARMLATIGNVYTSLALYDQAEAMLQEALELREELHGQESSDYADTLRLMGGLRRYQGRTQEARALLTRAYEIQERVAEPGSTRLALVGLRLGDLLSRTGEYDEAARLYRQSLEALEQAYGEDHEQVVSCLLMMGYNYRDADDLDASRESLTRALSIGERIHEPDHPLIGSVLNALAIVHWTEKDYGSARPLFERSLAIFEKVYPPDHPSLANMRNNMGRILRDAGDLEAARPYYEAALATFEKVVGPDHPDTATTLNNLALLLRDTGKPAEARPMLERAIRIRETQLGMEHRFLAEPLSGYADVLHMLGETEQAIPHYERAIRIRETILGPDHPDLLEPLRGYARALEAIGRTEDAAAATVRADGLRQSG